ncbi:MAG: ribulose-phosphate 3-epimerase [Kiritimatiellae bacterium]|nr:ribulose-phosphate 3-epimerase [Kiritimatiellia bacterium]
MPLPIQILPSLLAADFGRIAEECRRAETAGADALHLDVMDGHFVRNISFGPEIVRVARRSCGLPLHVHLMLDRPDLYVRVFVEAGAATLLIHVEARCDVAGALREIRALGARPGLTLNPETPLELGDPYLSEGLVDEVLLMSVHPGFGGQSFLEGVLPKIAALRAARPALAISVDGGIGEATGAACARAGANLLIAGTTLFGTPDMAAAIARLRAAACAAAEGAG